MTALMLSGVSAWASDLEDGLAALNARDYAKALQLLRPVALKGNAAAQNNLGSMYRRGLGVPKNYDEALKLFRLAAAQGHSGGQANLGVMYESGFGVRQDYEEAARWYLKAAAQGHEGAKKRMEGTWAMKSAVNRVTAANGTNTNQIQEGSKKSVQRQEKKDEKEKVRLADEARAKEQGRLAQEERTRNESLIAARQRDEELVRLRQQVAKLQDQKSSKDQKTVYASRRALIIGNDSYRQVTKLINAREDARAIAGSLQQFGYQVTLGLDMNEKDMKAALRTFKGQVDGGDEVLIFFAGHGVQLGAANYLLPVDITSDSEERIKDDSIPLQRILDDMSERKAKFTLAMIDACRDNPFKTVNRNIGGRGLAPTTAATGQMVIFSAGAGQQALDKLGPSDKNKNGLFTRVFLKEMRKPGVSVDKVLRNVRSEVVELAKSVGHEQVPAIYDQVVGEFYFRR